MNISWNWLHKLAELDGLEPREVYDRFTLHSAELEQMLDEARYTRNVFTVKVTGIRPHPDADKLRLVTVDTGKESIELVCGAPNVEQGKVAVYAGVGTELPGGFKIEKRKIRGVMSCGMLCSERELELSESNEGIIMLPGDTPLGIPYSELLGNDDLIFEIDNKSITHRPDLWGHLGIAREVCAVFGKTLRNPYKHTGDKASYGNEQLTVRNDVPKACPRYCGVIIKGLSICESPEWMKKLLTAVGSRPINNIVDVTNFISLELGQPMHAFDRRQINGTEIIIRMSEKGEKIVSLDEHEKTCTGEEIMIADSSRSVALGGVMGLANSEVSEDTTEIVLESANFDPAMIRRTANRFNMRTDSAQRFEKSQDPENALAAIYRFMDLIRETCPDAHFASEIADSYPGLKQELVIDITCDFIRTRLGAEIDDKRIISILTSLEFGVVNDNGKLTVNVPTFRATKDIEQAIDLVEEVGRVYGYDNIEPRVPAICMDVPHAEETLALSRQLRELLSLGLGFTEVHNYSFFNQEKAEKAGVDLTGAVRLSKPLSKEADCLVTDLLPNMLEAVVSNARHSEGFDFFEIGHEFRDESEQEKLVLCTYRKTDNNGEAVMRLRFALEELLTRLGLSSSCLARSVEKYHPCRSGQISSGKLNIQFGEIKPEMLKAFGIKGRVAYTSILVSNLLKGKKKGGKFREIPKFPAVPFDLTVVIPEKTHVTTIIRQMKSVAPDHLESVGFGGFYFDEKLGQEKKAATFHLVFRAKDHTLTGEERTDLEQKVMDHMKELGFSIK